MHTSQHHSHHIHTTFTPHFTSHSHHIHGNFTATSQQLHSALTAPFTAPPHHMSHLPIPRGALTCFILPSPMSCGWPLHGTIFPFARLLSHHSSFEPSLHHAHSQLHKALHCSPAGTHRNYARNYALTINYSRFDSHESPSIGPDGHEGSLHLSTIHMSG